MPDYSITLVPGPAKKAYPVIEAEIIEAAVKRARRAYPTMVPVVAEQLPQAEDDDDGEDMGPSVDAEESWAEFDLAVHPAQRSLPSVWPELRDDVAAWRSFASGIPYVGGSAASEAYRRVEQRMEELERQATPDGVVTLVLLHRRLQPLLQAVQAQEVTEISVAQASIYIRVMTIISDMIKDLKSGKEEH